ncbi:MAG: DUF11 domain-containing protein, partial [bacterium]|nr:DUF11 domain-containing protein [bacterium]
PGIDGSGPADLTNVNGTLYFQAYDGVNGHELWKSDGTSAGTVMVKDIIPGGASLGMGNLTNVNGTLYFWANDGVNGVELWKSDGTAGGTVMVKDIYPGSSNSNPALLTNVNGTLYFRGYDGVNGYELWKSDGTAGGTVMVKDIYPGGSGSGPAYLTNVNGTLCLRADDGVNGLELWKSDGTAAGTVLVKDIYPGIGPSFPSDLVNADGMLYFQANDGVNGYELWSSDGTAAGTLLVVNIVPASGGSSARPLLATGGQLFVSADDVIHGSELWRVAAQQVDIAVTKDDGVTSATPGASVTYTIVVWNLGPSDHPSLSVADIFPAVLTCGWTSLAGGGATGNTNGSGDLADTLSLPAGGSVTYTASCDIDSAATGTLSNTAAAWVVDNTPGNNSATDDDTVLVPEADLALEKTGSPAVPAGGGSVTYYVTVTNNGPSDATRVVVTDNLPAAVSLVSTSGCAEDPAGVPTCTLGTIAASASAQFTIEATVDAGPPLTFTNRAMVTSGVTDPSPGNDGDDHLTITDATPPEVDWIDTVAGTGDGELENCETARVAIRQLQVVFSEELRAGGGADAADNPDNYQLLASGPDLDFSTFACGVPAGDDELLALAGVGYQVATPAAAQSTATLDLLGVLDDALYRLIVCGSAADPAGNALAGGDLVLDFRVDRFNLFANGHLDCDLRGWQQQPPGGPQILFSPTDLDGTPRSGSVQVSNGGATELGVGQCVEDPWSSFQANPYHLGGSFRLDAAPLILVSLVAACDFYDGPGCAGDVIGSTADGALLADTASTFIALEHSFAAPAGTMSAFCEIGLESPDAESWDFFGDQLYLKQGSCTPSATELCLNEERFRVEVDWRDFGGRSGSGGVVPVAGGDS